MSNGSRGKRRRGAQQKAAQPAPTPAKATEPVQASGVTSRLPVVPWLVAGAIAVVALIAILVVFKPGTGTGGAAASASRRGLGAAGASAPPARARPAQPPALPAGETRTVTLNTPKGAIAIKVEADLSPIAAGNFVALASCGYYDGTVFHRPRPPGRHAVRHPGRRPDGTGTGGPGLHDQGRAGHDAVQARHGGDGPDRRARTRSARSSSSSSTTRTATSSRPANTYQIIGNVTSGMDAVDAISVASGRRRATGATRRRSPRRPSPTPDPPPDPERRRP